MELKDTFEAAVAASRTLPAKPDNDTLLQLYSLYKQATEGDQPADAPAPGMFDFVARAKADAWKKRAGQSSEAAMQEYIDLVKSLQQR
jgi:diazepam-binding inhibitor (GABA receptor modulating acyl-CoA-binding protein)